MSEVKLFRLSGSALAIDLRTGHNATLRPGLVVLSEDAHTHAMAALAAECERLQREAGNDAIAYRAAIERQNEIRAERDAALAELAALKGGRVAGWLNPDARDEYTAFVFEKDDTCDNWQPLYTAPAPGEGKRD